MKARISALEASISRRHLLRGAALGAGAAALATKASAAPFFIQSQDFKGTKVTWMTNQRHDVEVKKKLFAEIEDKLGIKVDFQVFADEYKDQLKLAFESGKAPDIYNMNAPRQEVEAGWPEPLDDYLAKTPGLKESFLPGAFVPNRGVWGGKSYGLPMYAQTMRLYYNKSLFTKAGLDPEKPPATFTELRQYAKEISAAGKKEQIYGFILGDKYTWVWWMNGICPGNNAGYYDFNWKDNAYHYNDDRLKEVMSLMAGIKQDGGLFPGIHTLTDDDARQQFSLGRAGMIIGGSWNPGVFNDQFKSTEDWETAYMPAPDAGLAGRMQQGIGDRYTLSAKGEKKDAAWEVLKYIYSLESMTTLYEQGMGVMGVAKANTGKSDVRGVPKLAPTEHDLIVPPTPELPTITPDQNTVLQAVLDADGKDMDKQLADVEKVYNETYQKLLADGTLKEEDFLIADFDPLTWQPTA